MAAPRSFLASRAVHFLPLFRRPAEDTTITSPILENHRQIHLVIHGTSGRLHFVAVQEYGSAADDVTDLILHSPTPA